jgi:phosphatidylglycerophosphate synthase
MATDGGSALANPEPNPSALKRNLADLLTASRALIGVIILLLSFIGKDAFTTVFVLALVGALTDILDGRAARRFLRKGHKGRLGRHDVAVDTLFVLCILAYVSLSGIVIRTALGLIWICLAVVCAFIWKFRNKALYPFEILTVMALFAVTAIHDLRLFLAVLMPLTVTTMALNRGRLWQVITEQIPRDYTE